MLNLGKIIKSTSLNGVTFKLGNCFDVYRVSGSVICKDDKDIMSKYVMAEACLMV